MEENERNQFDGLLDWRLDRLDKPRRSAIEERLREDASFRAARDRLDRVLQPLDLWSVAPPPVRLVDRVLGRVGHAGGVSSGTPAASRGFGRFRFFVPKGVLAAAACIVLLLGVFVPGISSLRAKSQRALCEANLGSIFRGVSAYQASFGGAVPFAGGDPSASWLPTAADDRPFQSNSRHIYLLVKGQFGPKARDFVCPACPDKAADDPSDPTRDTDFRRAGNYSYASLNLAGSNPCVTPQTAIPYLADNNPLFVNARFNAGLDPQTANSTAHRGRGQTILTLDGSAHWTTSPIYGVQRDNVWVIRNVRRYTGCEAPICETDVQLVPGYPKTRVATKPINE